MASKTDFTPEEWQVLQYAVTDTMSYVAMADPGFWDQFKEATAAARYISGSKEASPSDLVRDLAGDIHVSRDKQVAGNPADIAGEVAKRVSQASKLVAEKAPDDLEAFKNFLLGIANATAEAAKGVSAGESDAIDKIREALS